MIERGQSRFVPTRVSSLHLDYGADAQLCDHDAVGLCERGLRLRSRWHFDIGVTLSVAFVCPTARGGQKRVVLEGMVVFCETLQHDPKTFESTLLFLEVPEDVKASLRDFSSAEG